MALPKRTTQRALGSDGFDPKSILDQAEHALAEAGYSPDRDTPTRIVYKNNGSFFCLYYDEADPEFLLIRATFESRIYEHLHESFLYKACSITDYDQKVSKAYIDEEDNLIFSAEAFVLPGVPIDKLVLRLDQALEATIKVYHHNLEELLNSYEDEEEETPSYEFTPGGLPS